MFTGLIQSTGALSERTARGPNFRMAVSTEFQRLELGESIAVNGVCVTVAERDGSGFALDLSAESAARTTLARLPIGLKVNLERSLRVGDALGGHFVAGHVDGIGVVERVTPVGDARQLTVRPPAELVRFLAEKGSVAIDGVSLTINSIADGVFEIMLIPHTLDVTNLKHLAPSAEVNLEIDLLARYAVHWLETTRAGRGDTREPGRSTGSLQ